MKTLMLFLALMSLPVCAEDWTVNGKDYHNVIVGQVEPDRVHITYDGGVGTVMLSDLTPELQKRFGYDPAQAKGAAQKRDADQRAVVQSYASVDSLRNQIQAQNQAEQRKADAQDELASQNAGIVRNRVLIQGTVLEKTDDGLLVDCEPSAAPPKNHFTKDDLTQGALLHMGTPTPQKVYGIFHLTNYPGQDKLIDNDPVVCVGYPTGPYSYTTLDGARKTILSYSATLPSAN